MQAVDYVAHYERIREELGRVIVGQDALVEGVLVALVAGGHVLVEGPPGVGKTLVVRTLARALGATFKRVQFTPDLMPGDVTGSSVFDRERGAFAFVEGPIFTQLFLADEINRAPAKTQSALLEAMQEGQVTADGVSRALPRPFVVVATQNPIESQGTYPLPEAQLDRFLLKLRVEPPSREAEEAIVQSHARGFDPGDLSRVRAVASAETLLAMQAHAREVRIEESVTRYLVDLVRRTREDRALEYGASPRASLALLRTAQVMAASQGRGFVTPDDLKPMAKAVLRHRVILHPDAELQGVTADDRIAEIVRETPVPRAE